MLDHSHVSGRRETTTATVGRDPGYEARPGGAVAVATLGPNEWSISGRLLACGVVRSGVAVAVGHRASPRGSCRSWRPPPRKRLHSAFVIQSCCSVVRSAEPTSSPERRIGYFATWLPGIGVASPPYCTNGYIRGSRATPSGRAAGQGV